MGGGTDQNSSIITMHRLASLSFIIGYISRHAITSQCTEGSGKNDKMCPFENSASADYDECSLYLAPSTISGAGFGIFTTKDVIPGHGVLPYSDSTSIVVCDYDYFGLNDEDWRHQDYFWNGAGLASFECDSASESVMGFGALCNHHAALKNVHGYVQDYDDTVADRFTNPGAGAFSYYGGHKFVATKHIAAGDEIFADYGSNWMEQRSGTYADAVPRESDFDNAATIMNIVKDKMTTSKVEVNDPVLSSIKGVAAVFEKRTASLLPETKSEYDALLAEGNDLFHNIAKTALKKRDVEWIRDNGFCLDNIIPAKSTLPHAGQGAFAKRFIRMGTMISPAPLLQILDRDQMLIYESSLELEPDRVPVGTQILVNYCLGHTKSKLLLCPQTNAILVNHCSNRKVGGGQCGDKGPNAKFQWANGWDHDTNLWLEMSLEKLRTRTAEKSRGPSMELVSLRDIQDGEEIFIDYGPNWEDAWELHKKSWKPPNKEGPFRNYTPVKEMAGTKFRTVDELEENPYPDNIVTGCYWYEWEEEGYEPDEWGFFNAEDYINEDGGAHVASDIWECQILEELEDGYYDVRILEREVLLTWYPKESIVFRTKGYNSDQHLQGVFRQFIEIEEDLFPDQWKDIGQITGEGDDD